MSDKQQTSGDGEKNYECQNLVWEIKGITGRFCHWVIKGLKSPWPEESWTTFIFWILSIIIDPFVLYVPRINNEKKSLDFDRSFLLIISVLYLLISSVKLIVYWNKHKKSPILWWVFVVGAPLVPILAYGLLQVLLLFKSTKNIKASLFSFGMAVFLILYLVRILGIYRLFIATALRESAILRILNNLLLYFYGGHLFGGLWYFFAVWKKMQCWNRACTSHGGCHYAKRHFFVDLGGINFLDDMCFNMTGDTTNELGIFKDALQSHIVETPNLGKKLLYCLRWGIQNLSGYGQNLEVSTHAWENIFVIVIAVYGMATFTFFIGNMQNLIKSPTSKSNQETRWTREDLEKWSPFRKLSKKDQKVIVEKCQQYNKPQIGVVSLKNLLSNLPKDVEKEVKRVLCSELLKKVPEFRGWSNEWLNELCDCAKPVFYDDNTQIIKKGSSIDEMLFVVEGKLRIYSTSANAGTESTAGKKSVSHLEDDGFCGEELVNWFQDNPDSSKLPTSNRTIRVVKQVDAFAIVSDDLQFVMNEKADSASTEEQE